MSWDDDILMADLVPIAKDYYLYEDEQGDKTVYRLSSCNPVIHYIVDGMRELLGLSSYGILRTTNVTKKFILLDSPHSMKEGKLVIEGHCVYTADHRTKERDDEVKQWLVYRELLNLVATPFLLMEREGEVIVTAQPESIYSFEAKKFTSFQISDRNIATYFGTVVDFSRYASRWVEEHVNDRFYDEAAEFIRSVDERMIWILGHIQQREAMLRGINPDDDVGPSIPRTLKEDGPPLPWLKLLEGDGTGSAALRTVGPLHLLYGRSDPPWVVQLSPEQMKEKILAAG